MPALEPVGVAREPFRTANQVGKGCFACVRHSLLNGVRCDLNPPRRLTLWWQLLRQESASLCATTEGNRYTTIEIDLAS